MAQLTEIRHPECEKTAFFVPTMPIGRGLEYFDALNANGDPIAMGKRVECQNCHEKVDFDTINEYYEV